MWKEYSYDELKGVIKVGDRVRAVEGKHNPCGELEDDGSNEAKIANVNEPAYSFLYDFHINDCGHEYSEYGFLERWEPQERTIEDVQEGDVISNAKRSLQVIARVGQVVCLSESDFVWWSKVSAMVEGKYHIVTPDERVQVPKKEIAEWKGVHVSLIDIIE